MYACLGPGMIGLDVSFPRAAELAAAHGFEGLQVDAAALREHGPAAYRAVLSEHGLRPGSMGLPFRIDAPREEYDAGLAELDEVAAMAAEVGCERASTYVMSFSDDRTFEENAAFHRERIAPVAAILDEHGLDLGLEFLGPATLREGHAHEFVHTAAGMLDLCASVDADNLGLLLDSWHWYTAGGDRETLRALSRADVVDVHLNDAPERPRKDQVDSERRLPASTGVIDVGVFLGELDRIEYDGPVTVEPFSDAVEAMAPEAAVAATRDALGDAFAAAGD